MVAHTSLQPELSRGFHEAPLRLSWAPASSAVSRGYDVLRFSRVSNMSSTLLDNSVFVMDSLTLPTRDHLALLHTSHPLSDFLNLSRLRALSLLLFARYRLCLQDLRLTISLSLSIYIYMYTCICIYIHTCVCMYVHIYIYTHIHT